VVPLCDWLFAMPNTHDRDAGRVEPTGQVGVGIPDDARVPGSRGEPPEPPQPAGGFAEFGEPGGLREPGGLNEPGGLGELGDLSDLSVLGDLSDLSDLGAAAEEETELLPPVRLPAEDAVAGQVRELVLMERLLAFTHWLGRGGVTVEEDDEELLAELLDTAWDELPAFSRTQPAGEGRVPDDPRADLDLLWLVAREEGLITVGPEGAVHSTGYLDGLDVEDPRQLVDLWLSVAQCLIDVHVAAVASTLEPAGPDTGQRQQPLLDRTAQVSTLLEDALGTLHTYRVLREQTADVPPWPEPVPGMMPLPVLAGTAAEVDPYEVDLYLGGDPGSEDGSVDGPGDVSGEAAAVEQGALAMAALDPLLRVLHLLGMVEYRPPVHDFDSDDGLERMEAELRAAEGLAGEEAGEFADRMLGRLGLVRLTVLGGYGAKLLELLPGAPVLGEYAGCEAGPLLDAIVHYPDDCAEEELRIWLAGQQPAEAARRLLAGAGEEAGGGGPLRRIAVRRALPWLGAVAVETALREVLGDPLVGGLARVYLTEGLGRTDLPAAASSGTGGVDVDVDAVALWLAVDTFAGELALSRVDEDPDQLLEALRGSPAVLMPETFFGRAWRVDHPMVVEVLDAIAGLHPEERVAGAARVASRRAKERIG
jgi:hypothetical protein